MDSTFPRPPGSGPQPAYRAPPARRDWDRRDPHGVIRMAIVFVGAAVGTFILYPMIRPTIIADQHYAPPAELSDAGAPPAASAKRRHRHE